MEEDPLTRASEAREFVLPNSSDVSARSSVATAQVEIDTNARGDAIAELEASEEVQEDALGDAMRGPACGVRRAAARASSVGLRCPHAVVCDRATGRARCTIGHRC